MGNIAYAALNVNKDVAEYNLYIALFKSDGTLVGVTKNKTSETFNLSKCEESTIKAFL